MSAAAQQESGSPAAERAPLLRLDAIVKRFPGVLALDRVNFDLRPGEVHVLFGENGAGKSTLISIAAGASRSTCRRHRLWRRADPAAFGAPRPLARDQRGVPGVFLVPQMTVEENLFLGAEATRGGLLNKRELHRRAEAILARLGFPLRPGQKVASGARRAADGRDRQGVPRRALGPDPGRADRLAYRARDRPAVSPDRAGQARWRRRHLHHPSHE